MSTIYEKNHEEEKSYDDQGNLVKTSSKDTLTVKSYQQEPDYIKIYTRMWCEYNEIPVKWRPLFLALVTRMTYCNMPDNPTVNHGETGQLVWTGEPFATAICKECGWNQKQSLYNGLKALCKCGAIRLYRKSCYQINPQYAGRGSWRYDPKKAQGGVENLTATFNFSTHTNSTQITWSDDDENDD
jgi:hypothetical protein